LKIFRGDDTGLGEVVERKMLKLCAGNRRFTGRKEIRPNLRARRRSKRRTCNTNGRWNITACNHRRRRRPAFGSIRGGKTSSRWKQGRRGGQVFTIVIREGEI
jgi:hypothetical protein